MIQLPTGDGIDSPGSTTGLSPCHALLLSPQVREGRTKTGDYDCSNILDDVRHPRLGFQLAQFWDFRNGT